MRAARWTVGLIALGLITGGCGVWPSSEGSVVTLAKLDGWRGDFVGDEAFFAVLEIAYDDAAADALWADNVGADLPERNGKPLEAGVYGELSEVDLSRQVVALYSSGQSGSCPGWVSGVTRRDDGTVNVTREEDLLGGDGCTDDYNPYRVVVAIDRDDVPAPEELSRAPGTVDGRAVLEVLVGEYPVTDGS